MSAPGVILGISAQIPNSLYHGQIITPVTDSIPPGLLSVADFNWVTSDPSVIVETSKGTSLIRTITLNFFSETSESYPVTITVSDINNRYSQSIIIIAYPSITSLTLDVTDLTLSRGYTYTSTPTIIMSSLPTTSSSIVWSSSNPLIATVDQTGLITAIKNGTAVIKASITDYKENIAEINITVGETPGTSSDPITGGTVRLPPIYVGKSASALLNIIPSDAIIVSTVWSSSDPTIAYVNPISGLVTGASSGSFTITANVTDSTTVVTPIRSISYTCLIAIGSIVLSPASIQNLQIGESYTATTTSIYPSNATSTTLVYSSLNPSIATATYSGGTLTITGISNGTATIVAKSPDTIGVTRTMTVFVENSLSSATNNVPATLILGKAFQAKVLTATGTNIKAASYSSIIWTTSNSLVATVSAKGLIQSVGTGTCAIGMTINGKSGTVTNSKNLTITKPVVSFVVYPTALNLAVGTSATLTTTIFPMDGDYSSITWTSSNPAVATVNSTGQINAIKSGSTSITVSLGNTSIIKKVPILVGLAITAASITMPSTIYMGTPIKPIVTLTPSGAVADFISWNPSLTKVTSHTLPSLGQITSSGLFIPSIEESIQAASATELFKVTVGNQFTTGTITALAPEITVVQPLLSLKLPSIKFIDLGDTYILKPVLFPLNALDSAVVTEGSVVSSVPPSINWYAENTEVIDIDSSGNITTIELGTSIVIATSRHYPTISASSLVVVTNIQNTTPLDRVSKIAIDSNGNIFMVQRQINSIYVRNSDSYQVNLYFGNGTLIPGYTGDDGDVSSATLNHPYDIALDSLDQLYVIDSGNNVIRKVDVNKIVSTFHTFDDIILPLSITIDSNDVLYVACQIQHLYNVIYKFNTVNGNLSTHKIYIQNTKYQPCILSMTTDSIGNLYVADGGNSAIYKFDGSGNSLIDTSGNILPYKSSVYSVYSMVTDSFNSLYYTDTSANRICKIDTSKKISIIAGSGSAGYSGDGGLARNAMIDEVQGLAIHRNGQLYISDSGNYAIRKVSNNIISHVVGPANYGSVDLSDPDNIIIEQTTLQARWNSTNNIIVFYNPPTTRILNLIKLSSDPNKLITVYVSGNTLPENTIIVNRPVNEDPTAINHNDSIFFYYLNRTPTAANTGSTISHVYSIDPENETITTDTQYNTDLITVTVKVGRNTWLFPTNITSLIVSNIGNTGIEVTWVGGEAPGAKYQFRINGVSMSPLNSKYASTKSALFLGLTPGNIYIVELTVFSFRNKSSMSASTILPVRSLLSDIPDLQLWVDSSILAESSGTTVTNWENIAPNSDYALIPYPSGDAGTNWQQLKLDYDEEIVSIPYPSGNNPVISSTILNNKKVLSFSSGQGLVVSPSFQSLYVKNSFFAVSRQKDGSSGRIFDGANVNQAIGYLNGKKKVLYLDGIPAVVSGESSNTSWDVISLLLDSEASYTLNWNGTTLYYADTTTNRLDTLGINSGYGYEQSDCEVAEVILYSSLLTTEQSQKIEGYLAWKWGLQRTLPLSHPYYTNAPSQPATATFSNIEITNVSANSVTVSWTCENDATSYIYILDNSIVIPASDNGLTGSAVFKRLKPSTTYSLILVAVNGARSVTSSPITLTTTSISSFVLSDIPSLHLWLDGRDSSLPASGGVTTWNDKSTNQYNFSQSVEAKRPTVVSGGGLQFSAEDGNELMNDNGVPMTASITMFVVSSGSTLPQTYFYASNNGTQIIMNFNGQNSISQFNCDSALGGDGIFVTSLDPLPSVMLYNFTREASTSNTVYYFGSQVHTHSPTVNPNYTLMGLIGSGQGSAYFDGVIYEFIIYSQALDDTDRQNVEGYLAEKWNLKDKLPSNHPYYSAT